MLYIQVYLNGVLHEQVEFNKAVTTIGRGTAMQFIAHPPQDRAGGN